MPQSHIVVQSAARTSSSNSGAIEVVDAAERGVRAGNLGVLVDVTATGGVSQTMDLEVEWSNDGTTFGSAETADTFTQITGTTLTVKRFTVKAEFYRIKWTLGGTTPSFTFSVSVVETI